MIKKSSYSITFAGPYFLFWTFPLVAPRALFIHSILFIYTRLFHWVFLILFRSLSPEIMGIDWDVVKIIVLQESYSVYGSFSNKLIKDELVLTASWRILVPFAILLEVSGLVFLLLIFRELQLMESL